MHISRSHANLSSSNSSDSISSMGSDKLSRESILQRDEELLIQLLLTATPFVRSLFYTKQSSKQQQSQQQAADDSFIPPPPSPGTATFLHWATGESGSSSTQLTALNKQLSAKSVWSDAESLSGSEACMLLSPAEYLTWLMEENVMQSLSKQPDTAFHGARLYYRYRDPWEVCMYVHYMCVTCTFVLYCVCSVCSVCCVLLCTVVSRMRNVCQHTHMIRLTR